MRQQRALKRTKRQTVPQGFRTVRCANMECKRWFTVCNKPQRCECGSSRAFYLDRPVVIFWKIAPGGAPKRIPGKGQLDALVATCS